METPDIVSSRSPSAMHTRGGDGAHMQITRIELGEKFKATMFALSVIVNIVLALAFFWLMQDKRVDEEYHIQTAAEYDKVLSRVELLEQRGPLTVIVKQEK